MGFLKQARANNRIRRFTKHGFENANPANNQVFTESPENVLAFRLALLAKKDPDLALVVERSCFLFFLVKYEYMIVLLFAKMGKYAAA